VGYARFFLCLFVAGLNEVLQRREIFVSVDKVFGNIL